jgi:AcrR family transcriptional regulator
MTPHHSPHAALDRIPTSLAEKKATTHAHLVAIASDLFRRSGVRATSIDDIVAATGVTKPTLYRHFPSKDELVVACLQDEGRRERLELMKVADDAQPTPSERMRAIGHHYARRFGTAPRRGLFALNLAVEYPDADGPVNAAIRAEVESFQDRLEMLISPDRPVASNPFVRQLTLAVFGASAGCQAVGASACDRLTESVEAIIAGACLT